MSADRCEGSVENPGESSCEGHREHAHKNPHECLHASLPENLHEGSSENAFEDLVETTCEGMSENVAESSAENPLAAIQGAPSLIKFALPSVITMAFMGLYTLVDVVFVARFVSTDALSAINIVCPVINLTVGFATMLATGGSAIIAAKMGCGEEIQARRDFSLIILFGVLCAMVIAILGTVFLTPICRALGATDRLLPFCETYLLILLAFTPASVLQVLFQNLTITAGKPTLGTYMAVLCGVGNIALDYLFMAHVHLGIAGAAWGTALGYTIAAVIGGVFFLTRREGLRFASPSQNVAVLAKACTNGVSEMVSQLATAVTTFLFNAIMLTVAGEDGVAAITIAIYSQFMVTALLIGFSMGVAPVLSFNLGAQRPKQLKRLFKVCVRCICGFSIALTFTACAVSPLLCVIFAPPESPVYLLTRDGLGLFFLSFPFAGLNIFASAAFTAFSNGKLSALISFLRTFGLVPLMLLFLPAHLGIPGVWLAVPFAEALTATLSILLLHANGKRYGYR